jgi:Bax protein
MEPVESSKRTVRQIARSSSVVAALLTICLSAPAESSYPTPLSIEPVEPIRDSSAVSDLVTFEPVDLTALVRIVDALWREVGQGQGVPNVAPASLPAGWGGLDVSTRKRAFVRGVLPYVLDANRAVARDRALLVSTLEWVGEGLPLGEPARRFLGGLAARYRLTKEFDHGSAVGLTPFLEKMLARVDVIPASLAIAQAALESGWGSSRFLRQGNALFGQWVFSANKGMAPARRPAGAEYSVARFDGFAEAVAAYVRNLNTLWAYKSFREDRSQLRRTGLPLSGLELARGLLFYSERREQYVDEVRQVIRTNGLARFDKAQLTPLNPMRINRILSTDGRLTARESDKPAGPDA